MANVPIFTQITEGIENLLPSIISVIGALNPPDIRFPGPFPQVPAGPVLGGGLLPTPVSTMPRLPTVARPVGLIPELGIPFVDVVREGTVCITPRVSQAARLPSRVDVPTGDNRFVTFKNMGAPILFAGDVAAARRVRRVGRKALAATGGR